MFHFREKKKTENYELKKELQHIYAEIANIHKKQEHQDEQKTKEKETFQKILAKQSKQGLMLEDLIEGMEEEKEERKEKEEQREKEFMEEKEKLVDTLISAAEYLYQMERQVDNAAWEEQIRLVRSQMGRQMYACGIQEIAETGRTADPSLHEAMDSVNTTEQAQDKEIKEVLIPAYLYKKKVKKRAKVIIYTKEKE